MDLKLLARETMADDWFAAFQDEFAADYMRNLEQKLTAEELEYSLLPKKEEIFHCFRRTPLSAVKVVLLGQDPYPNPEYAHGLCFSVKPDVFPYPMSLRNLFRELASDLAVEAKTGSLLSWADRGVLLLNSTLTVRSGESQSHAKFGWSRFTDRAIEIVSEKTEGTVFVLLGNFAAAKLPLVDQSRHSVLCAAHPSPLSARRGFFGSRIFSKVNDCLRENGRGEIDFSI